MKTISTFAPLFALPHLAVSQDVTVPPTCEVGTTAANDVVLYTLPYPYDAVLSIIGSYKNLTWSGSPDDTVTLNGSDNTVGTARTYDIAGAHVIETILNYDSPPGGPYYENHNVAPLTIPLPTGNISLYCQTDATTVTSTCGGKATMFNFTAECCSNNATGASGVLHLLHSTDAMTVGKFLGGENFTSCDALGTGGSNATTTAPPSVYTGGAATGAGIGLGFIAGVVGAGLLL